MSSFNEKAAYLKGLLEGMQINDSTNEGKLLKAIVEVVDDIKAEMDDIKETQRQLNKRIDGLQENIAEIERVMFDEDEYEDQEDDFYFDEIECPHCKEKIDIDEDIISDEGGTIECPNCQSNIELFRECDCEECDECKE